MSTTSASAASGGDTGRAGYVRSTDTSADSKRLRIDNASFSAFDLLLDLPIFDSTVIEPKPVAPDKPVEPTGSEDKDKPEETSKDSDNKSILNPFVAPLIKNIEEPATKVPVRVSEADSAVHPSEASTSNDLPVVDAKQETALKDTPQTTAKPNAIEPTIAASDEAKPIVDVNQDLPQQNNSDKEVDTAVVDQNPTELSSVAENSPVDSHKQSNDSRTKSNDTKEANEEPQHEVQAAKPIDSRPQERPKDKSDQELSKKQPTSAPIASRRAERLAEVKRGERSNDDGEQSKSEQSSHDNSIRDLPLDAAKGNEELDASKIKSSGVTPSPTDVTSSLIPDKVNLATSTNITPAVVVSGLTNTHSQSTATAGIEGNKSTLVGSVNSIQGSSTVTQNQSTKSAPPSTGGSTKLTPYQESRVLQRVLKGLDQLKDGGGQVRLRLHPPELGSLQVTIRVESQHVSALIEVEHSSARDVLLNNLPQLQSQLSDQGLNISQFDVKVVDPSQWSQGSDSGFAFNNGQGTGQNDSEASRSSRYLDRLRNQIELTPSPDAAHPVQSQWTRKNGELDLTV